MPTPPPPAVLQPDFACLLNHLADAVYLLDPETSNIVWCNREGWASLGLSPEDVLNHSVLSLQKDVHGLPQWSEIADIIRRSESFRFVGRHRHQQGHEVPVEVNTTCLTMGGRSFFLSTARNIANRMAQQDHAGDRGKQLWYALNEAGDGLWDWEVPTGSLYFSPQLKRMLGYGPDEMAPVLSTWSDNVHPEDAPRVMAILGEHMEGKRSRYEAEYRLRNRNGHYLWVHDRGQICERNPHGQPIRVVGMVQDISHRKKLELQLQELASCDPLTGLANRRQGTSFLETQFAQAQAQGGSLGLAFIDLDHFKRINDLHGHRKGDEMLQIVGNLIRNNIRGSDLLCRWGGEEFVLIAPSTSLTQMVLVAEKIRSAVAEATQQTFPVTLSIGVSAAAEPGHSLACLMAAADSAMYQAKEGGRNRVEACPLGQEPSAMHQPVPSSPGASFS